LLKKAIFMFLVLIIALLALGMLSAVALAEDFPLEALNGDLVADEGTKFITLFEQGADGLITATVQVQNGGDKDLVITGIGIQISFNEKVAPYNLTKQLHFPLGEISGASAAGQAEFSEYCQAASVSFNTLGSQYMQRDSSGGMLSAKFSGQKSNDAAKIRPGQTESFIHFFFMPLNGTDPLDIDMFSYRYLYNATDFSRHTTWIGNGSRFLQATGQNMPIMNVYVVSPGSFKMHMQLPTPVVSANNTNRTINGYNPATMEWSDSADGPYKSAAPTARPG